MTSQLNLKYCVYQKEVLKCKEVLYAVILSRAEDFQLYEMQTVKALGIFFNAILVVGKENPNKTN